MYTFFLIVLLSMLYEHSVDQICPKGLLISFLHHILSTFMLTAPFLFNQDTFTLMIWVGVWLGYKFVGKCITTIKYNEICGKEPSSEFKNVFAVERDVFGTQIITWLVPTLLLLKIIYSKTNYYLSRGR